MSGYEPRELPLLHPASLTYSRSFEALLSRFEAPAPSASLQAGPGNYGCFGQHPGSTT